MSRRLAKFRKVFTIVCACGLSVIAGTAATYAASVKEPTPSRVITSHPLPQYRGECLTTCVECTANGFVGAYRYFGPLTNDYRAANNQCDVSDACTFGSCFALAVESERAIEAAVDANDWERINELAVTRSNVVPDLRRDVVDIVSCDGKTVVSTFSLPHQIVARMAAAQSGLETMTLAVTAF